MTPLEILALRQKALDMQIKGADLKIEGQKLEIYARQLERLRATGSLFIPNIHRVGL